MEITKVTEKDVEIAILSSDDIVITDVQSALDLMATVRYTTNCNHLILDKSAICDEFFDLKTRLAGEILQKFVNYQFKLAITGDFSVYPSESLRAFIYECNNGNAIFFLPSSEEAIERLSGLP